MRDGVGVRQRPDFLDVNPDAATECQRDEGECAGMRDVESRDRPGRRGHVHERLTVPLIVKDDVFGKSADVAAENRTNGSAAEQELVAEPVRGETIGAFDLVGREKSAPRSDDLGGLARVD